ncbi:MAG: hypothetical protein JXB38_21845 [Anaerolineales bacterium]|nr:hypothetical protein [Anaerolineales bacterium]
MNPALKSALTNPINLMMLALSAAAGLCSAWWLFPIGIVLWVVMVVLVTSDPNTKIRENISKRPTVAYRFQKTIDRIERSQIKIYNTIQQTSSRHQRAFHSLMAGVNKLSDNAYNLAERMTIVENHRITSDSPPDIKDRIKAAELKLETTTDEILRKEQESILQTLQSRLDNVEGLARTLDRAEAQLNSMLTELENTLTEVVRMQSMDAGDLHQPVEAALEVLDRESKEAADFKMQLTDI